MPAEAGLVLSLFPGIGLLDMAFEEEGFCVVRGPDVLWGGDIRRFHPPAGKFDGVIGGPPCQAFSRLRHLVAHVHGKRADNLIPEYERCVAASRPRWFLMENVEDAPEPRVDGYIVHRFVWNNRWCGAEQNRLRSFAFGSVDGKRLHPEGVALLSPNVEPAVLASAGKRGFPVKIGGSGQPKKSHARAIKAGVSRRPFERSLELQGLPSDFLANAPFTIEGKCRVVGNGVPLPMGRAIARAVKQALAERAA